MLKIRNLNTIGEIEYQGIFVIETKNSDSLISDFYKYEYENNEDVFLINSKSYSIQDAIIISNLTKLTDLYNLTSKNILTKMITNEDNLNIESNIDKTKFFNSLDLINNQVGENLLDLNFDKIKILKSLISFNDSIFIDETTFLKWMDNYDSTIKPFVILKDLNFIKISKLEKYINKFNILIINNDLFGLVNEFQELEICSLENNGNLTLIDSYLPLHTWIENKINNFQLNCDESFNILKNDKFLIIELLKNLN
ncbi:hypothetical protein [Mycoplasma sp. CSL7503-lung]|uniref:hypothetical protein n=1 Tax=Mycoplasma sp. CSL7503-lung TaxID=536372 RepID=UPI0021CE01E2|nr:hypothetical protein [Mycoplasma sp. CSL7503-lung]MCU4706726.1 hypothetical protein [Mycoplasma sp. CSL7503-lung]